MEKERKVKSSHSVAMLKYWQRRKAAEREYNNRNRYAGGEI
jgi:hypothetical protein